MDDRRLAAHVQLSCNNSHDLILRETSIVLCAFHGIFTTRIEVFHKCQAERATTVLIAGEFS